jgi:NTE family protein
MNARWEQGILDASTTLCVAPWLAPKPREVGVRVFDVMHDILVQEIQAAANAKPTDSDRRNLRPTEGHSSENLSVK